MLKRNLIILTLSATLLLGFLYYKGILVSLNFTHDVEMKLSDAPEGELEELHDFLQPVINSVLNNYSSKALLQYTRSTNPNAEKNYNLAMNYFRTNYGQVVDCPDSEAIYIKQYSLFAETKYFWRLSSNCKFEKANGTVNFEVNRSTNGWVLQSFGII